MIDLFKLQPNAVLRPANGPSDQLVDEVLGIHQGGRLAFWYALYPMLVPTRRPEHITEGLA